MQFLAPRQVGLLITAVDGVELPGRVAEAAVVRVGAQVGLVQQDILEALPKRSRCRALCTGWRTVWVRTWREELSRSFPRSPAIGWGLQPCRARGCCMSVLIEMKLHLLMRECRATRNGAYSVGGERPWRRGRVEPHQVYRRHSRTCQFQAVFFTPNGGLVCETAQMPNRAAPAWGVGRAQALEWGVERRSEHQAHGRFVGVAGAACGIQSLQVVLPEFVLMGGQLVQVVPAVQAAVMAVVEHQLEA